MDQPNSVPSSSGANVQEREFSARIDPSCVEIIHRSLMRVEINKHIISKKLSTREKILELRQKITCDNNNSKNGVDAFAVFPEEVWKMIFGYVTDEVDLFNCSRVCSKLGNLIRETDEELLFKRVLPFFIDKLQHKDVLNCRSVCRKWCSGVDQVLEDGNWLTKAADNETDPKYTRVSYKILTSGNDTWLSIPIRRKGEVMICNMLKNLMASHSRNPFIGREVHLNACVAPRDDRRSIRSEILDTVTDFGLHIYHLHLKIENKLVDMRIICCDALKACTNLRTLALKIYEFDKLTEFNPDDIPSHQSLEGLHVEGFWLSNTVIQDALIRKYSTQLKFLKLFDWNGNEYENISWENLKNLELEKGRSIIFWESLANLQAPRLKDLSLVLRNTSMPQFRKLMRVLNGFQEMTTVTLNFDYDFPGFASNELLKNELDREPKCSKTITCLTLELHMHHKENLSSDFLTFFPFLKRLIFKTYQQSAEGQMSLGRRDEQFRVETRTENVIQLSSHICLYGALERQNRIPGMVSSVYGSNIWRVLTRLEVLETFDSTHMHPRIHRRAVYTRKRWEEDLSQRAMMNRVL